MRGPEIDLACAALAVARIEYPDLPPSGSLAALDDLAARSAVSRAGGGRRALDRLLVIDANAPTHLRDRGTVLVRLGELHRGASEWERYLTRYPQARDAAAFKEELRRVRQTLAERN